MKKPETVLFNPRHVLRAIKAADGVVFIISLYQQSIVFNLIKPQ